MNEDQRMAFILLAFLIIGTHVLVYREGLKQGEINYKQSTRIYKAFESAYHYGYMDCREGKPESWDGE